MAKAILELEMPESCWKCPLIHGELSMKWCGYSGKDCLKNGRRLDCPLIDKDEFLKKHYF